MTGRPPLRVVFVNENTLGHGSYLPPFVRELEARPDLGIEPVLLNAVPMPRRFEALADFTVPGLRRYGLDFHVTRWRLVVSRYVRARLAEIRAQQRVDAVVVNTQSVGLGLSELALELPVFVCVDATFAQLARSPWFARDGLAGTAARVALRPIVRRERLLFSRARAVLGWSDAVVESLRGEYAIEAPRAMRLPPSVKVPARAARPREGRRPRILFIGGDFRRKGGPLLLDCFRRGFADRCELHVVTHSDLPPEPGVFVHRGVRAHTDRWRELWETADLFVFPSALETFGIVLLEALGFGVPVVSSDAGAAAEILDEGEAGWLLPEVTSASLTGALAEALAHPDEARRRAERGRERVEARYELGRNAALLAGWIRGSVEGVRAPAPGGAGG